MIMDTKCPHKGQKKRLNVQKVSLFHAQFTSLHGMFGLRLRFGIKFRVNFKVMRSGVNYSSVSCAMPA